MQRFEKRGGRCMVKKRGKGRLAMALVLLMMSSLLCSLGLSYAISAAESRMGEEAPELNIISRTASMSVPAEPERGAVYRAAPIISTDSAQRMQRAILFSAAGYLPAWFAPRDGRRGAFAFFKVAGIEGFPDYGIVMRC